MPKTAKQPTIIIPLFTGTTAQEFRSHKLQLDTIFHTLSLLKVFDGTERFPVGLSRNRQKAYEEKSKQVNQILTQSFSQSYTATSIISNHRLGKWRTYWKELKTYYDNTTELAGVNHQEFLINLCRQNNEDIKDFIVRLDNAISNCRTHHIQMSQSLLNSKLLNNTVGHIKTMVLMKISEGKTINEIKGELLDISNFDNQIQDNNNEENMGLYSW